MTESDGESAFIVRARTTLRAGSAKVRSKLVTRQTAVFGLFTLITAAWFAPMLARLNSSVLVGPNDETYAIRSYWGAEQDGKTPFTWQHDELNGAPEGFPFAPAVQIANFVQPGFVWILRDVLGLYGAFNLFMLLGFVLTGFTVYYLCQRIGLSLLPALFAGYAIAFNPWMIERAYAGHAGYMHAWIFPALVLVLLRMHRARSLASAAVVGLVLGLAFYVSSYYGLLASLLVAVFLAVHLALVHGLPERLYTFTLACVCFGVTGMTLVPAALAWLSDRSAVAANVSNDVQQLQSLGASTESYLLPSTRHPLLGDLTRSFDVLADQHWAENTLYVGYITLALAFVGAALLIRRRGRLAEHLEQRTTLVFAAALVPVAFLFSMKRMTSVFGIDVPMPSYAISQLTTFWRVYARFGVLVLFALALLAAFALHEVARRRNGRALAVLACALLVFEFWPGAVPVYATDNREAYAEWLSEQPSGIVANYPLPTDSPEALDLVARAFYQQMHHGQPNYAAFGSGLGGTREEAIRLLSRYIDDPLTPGILAAEGVHYVLLHDSVYRAQGDTPPPVPTGFRQIESLAGDVRVVVLRDDVQPEDLDALLEQNAVALAAVRGLPPPTIEYAEGFSDPGRRDGEAGWRSLATDGAALGIENDDPRVGRVQLLVRGAGVVPQTLRLHSASGSLLDEAVLDAQPTHVVLGPVPIETGATTVRLTADGPVSVAPIDVQPLADFSISLRRR